MGNQVSMGSVTSNYPQSSSSNYPQTTTDTNDIEAVPASMESNTKFGKWKDMTSCDCSSDHLQVLCLRIVRTPLMSPVSDISLTSLRVTANIFTAGYVEQWLGTNNVPMEHQALECDAVCINCDASCVVTYTFEYLGGVGKQCRAGCYTNKYEGCFRQRSIKYTTLFLSDVYGIYSRMHGKWKSKHYDAVHNNCQQFAQQLWRELFGANEDDFGEWQSFALYQCGCDEGNAVYVQQMKLIRVQRCSAVKDDDNESVIKNSNELIDIDDSNNTADDDNILYALQIMCQCRQCGNQVPYTLESSARGKYFRCGAYSKKLRTFREHCRTSCLSLGDVHALFKECDFTPTRNKKWTCILWNNLLKKKAQSTPK